MSALIAAGSFVIGLVGYIAWASESRLESFTKRGLRLQEDQPGSTREPENRYLFLFWKSASASKEDIQAALATHVIPALTAKFSKLTYYYDDPGNKTPLSAPPALAPLAPPISGMVSFGPVEDATEEEAKGEVVGEVKALFSAECFDRVEAYLVEESVYTDYGEYAGPANSGYNPKLKRRWRSGERSPFPVVLTMFPMREKFKKNKEAFKKRWFGVQSPMSEIMQPRIRYVRRYVHGERL